MILFSTQFAAESCMKNVLYNISKLPCKINQCELECIITTNYFYCKSCHVKDFDTHIRDLVLHIYGYKNSKALLVVI